MPETRFQKQADDLPAKRLLSACRAATLKIVGDFINAKSGRKNNERDESIGSAGP